MHVVRDAPGQKEHSHILHNLFYPVVSSHREGKRCARSTRIVRRLLFCGLRPLNPLRNACMPNQNGMNMDIDIRFANVRSRSVCMYCLDQVGSRIVSFTHHKGVRRIFSHYVRKTLVEFKLLFAIFYVSHCLDMIIIVNKFIFFLLPQHGQKWRQKIDRLTTLRRLFKRMFSEFLNSEFLYNKVDPQKPC